MYLDELFCFNQKTTNEMRISDLSTHLFSSDLAGPPVPANPRPDRGSGRRGRDVRPWAKIPLRATVTLRARRHAPNGDARRYSQMRSKHRIFPRCDSAGGASAEIGRASCRERVCQYV